MYGNGVHAYFAGDYVKAHELLTSAIDAGSHDPRCYYFRGLAYLKLGRPQEAEGDFQQGAKLESADLNRTYNVARSLERVQGPARLEVEEHRAAARMAKLEQDEKIRKQRYEELNREERRALESQVGPPPAKGGPEGRRSAAECDRQSVRQSARRRIRRKAGGRARKGQVGTGHRGEEAGRRGGQVPGSR